MTASARAAEVISPRLQTVSAVDAAEQILRERIVEGMIVGGERIRESVLAGAIGVSRNTLRAALTRLASVGLLEYRENRGWSVPLLPRAEYEDILLLRESIESAAYRVIIGAGTMPSADVDAALQRIVDMDESVGWAERLEADAALHQSLVDLAHSPRLSRAFGDVLLELRLARLQSVSWLERLGLEEWKKIHTDLVENVRLRNASALMAPASFMNNDPWRSPRAAEVADAQEVDDAG